MYDRPLMPTRSEPDRQAEGRAVLCAFLANAWRDPDDALVSVLGDGERWRALLECGGALHPDVFSNLRQARIPLGASGSGLRPSEVNRLRDDHSRLFGHSVRGTCPPYELEYGRSEIIQQTAELADLTGFYGAFGMQIGESACERADHVAVECEFLGVLYAKEAWGQEQELHDLAESCADAQRLFLRDHLARWLPAFAFRVEKADPGGFYGRLAALTRSFIQHECRRFDIECGPQWLEVRPADPERDASIDCDTGDCPAEPNNQLVQLGMDRRTEGER